jgi:hypothetical protein
VATASQDMTIGLWRPHTGKFLATLAGHTAGVSRVLFSADDRFLISTGDDQRIFVWETATHQTVTKILRLGEKTEMQDKGMVTGLAVSPDGRYLAWSAGSEAAVHVVDLALGRGKVVLPGHGSSVTALAFSPDGRRLASGSADTTVLVWGAPAWETTATRRPPLDNNDLDKLWMQLARSDDVPRVYETIAVAMAAPGQVVPFLKGRLGEGKKAKTTLQLIADLDDKLFTVRQQAFDELENRGELARPEIVKAIDGKPSLEMRKRLDDLLLAIDQRKGRPSADELRQIRAVQMLEWIGSGEARKLLKELSAGSPTMWQTREAKAALERLAKRGAD